MPPHPQSPVRELNSFNNTKTLHSQFCSPVRYALLSSQLQVSSNRGRPVRYALEAMRDYGPAHLKARIRAATSEKDKLLVMPNANRSRGGRPRCNADPVDDQLKLSAVKWRHIARGSYIVWSALLEMHGYHPSTKLAYKMVNEMSRSIHADYAAEVISIDPSKTMASIPKFDMQRR